MPTGRSLTVYCSLLPGGVPGRGVSAPGGGWVSQHALRQIPLPPGHTHACKNITLAQLRCGGNNLGHSVTAGKAFTSVGSNTSFNLYLLIPWTRCLFTKTFSVIGIFITLG